MTFEEWMAEVDIWLVDECGLDSMCLEDNVYRDFFDNGMMPEEAGRDTLENAGYVFDL